MTRQSEGPPRRGGGERARQHSRGWPASAGPAYLSALAPRAREPGDRPQLRMLASKVTTRLATLAVAAACLLPEGRAVVVAARVSAHCPNAAVDCTAVLQAALNDTAADDLLIPPRSGGANSETWPVQPLLIASDNTAITLSTTLEARTGYFHGLHDMLVTVRGASNVSLRGDPSGAPGELRMCKQEYLSTDPATGAPLYKHSEWRHALGIYGSSDVHVAHLLIAWAGGDGIYVDGVTSGTITSVHVNESYRNAVSIISATGLVVSDCLFASAFTPSCVAHTHLSVAMRLNRAAQIHRSRGARHPVRG
eukprot:COSAG03_NODE_1082_length_4861_cov_8.532129_2_plen_308_part_00